MKFLTTIISMLFLSALLSAQEVKDAPKQSDYSALSEKALENAGDNKDVLKKAIANAPAEHKEAMQFLIAYMPPQDLKTLRAKFLLANVALAYKARETFPWAKEVPKEIFYNDILPYAALNETRDDWRQDFYDRFSKHVKDAKTMEEAILAVNKAIKDEVGVEYNTKRNKPHQSPYESMEIKMASCTGLSILLNDAFRAVGIPSRVAGIPAWTTKRGNHNWVEVWTPSDQQWHFTEYYLDAKGLDHGWLLADAAKANPKSFVHSVYASSWKPTEIHFPMVWNMKDKSVPGVNVSERYIKLGNAGKKPGANVCQLRIDYTVDGKRTSIPVTVVQGDVEMFKGITPDKTKDMNQFLNFEVKKGQIYQIAYMLPGTKKWQFKEVKTDNKAEFLRVQLEKKAK